jgi:hypothetical protein
MAPADDPEEFIAASVYWHPMIFPTRTEVLDHTFLCNGNGYEWGSDGKIHSVFAHVEPDLNRDLVARYERDADEEEARYRDRGLDVSYSMTGHYRKQAAALRAIRADYLHLARTYGPVRVTEQDYPDATGRRARMVTGRDLKWTLLGRAPAYVAPAWRPYLAEVRELFAPVLVEQGALWEVS